MLQTVRRKPPTKQEIDLVRSRLLPTWQTAAAIGQHAGLPAKRALAVLQRYANDWALEHRLLWIDGHNAVHMYRKRQMVFVMGVSFPLPQDDEAEGV